MCGIVAIPQHNPDDHVSFEILEAIINLQKPCNVALAVKRIL